jgi:hypothetical protein
MPIRIADPAVVAKIERLAAAAGLSKTAAVERAVDELLANCRNASKDDFDARASAYFGAIGSNSVPHRCI